MKPSSSAPWRTVNPPPVLHPDPSPPVTAPTAQEPPGSPFFPSAFDWSDAAHARTWLDAVRQAGDDLAALAREGSRLHKHRVLSRAELRRQTNAAERSLHALLAQAEAGLPPGREG